MNPLPSGKDKAQLVLNGARGVDILTTQEAENLGGSDLGQLIFAAENKKSMFSYNKRQLTHIHYEWMDLKKYHAGIILSDQLALGVILRRLMRLYYSLTSEEMGIGLNI